MKNLLLRFERNRKIINSVSCMQTCVGKQTSCTEKVKVIFFHSVRMNYGPCVDRLLVGDRLAVRRGADGAMRFRHVVSQSATDTSCVQIHCILIQILNFPPKLDPDLSLLTQLLYVINFEKNVITFFI